jgi:hypothetical protein
MRRGRTDLGRVVAHRALSEKGFPQRKIVVSIGLPRRDQEPGGDWECPFLIEGFGKSKVQKAFGVDSVQALILAIQGIRVNLEQTGRDLFWLDPQNGADFPLNVPTTWGKQFVERVRLAIEREIVRVWRAKAEASRAKIRGEEAELKKRGKIPRQVVTKLAERKMHLQEWEADLDKLRPGWSIPTPSLRKRR